MAEIYGNSFLIISAQIARDCNDGFLDSRTQSKFPPFKMPYFPRNGNYLSWKRRKYGFVSAFAPAVVPGKEFLSRRAWALQEFKLARRVLEYGLKEIMFRCCTGTARESLGERMQGMDIWGFFRPFSPSMTLDKCYLDWYRTIFHYSGRDLTYPKDKLPAISGYAH